MIARILRRLSGWPWWLRFAIEDHGRAIAPAPFHPKPDEWSDDRVTVSLLGHATVLINFYGFTILTDPVFSARIGVRIWPLTIGPKRHIRCALTVRELPPIDLILLSHAHMDHLDKPTLRRLPRSAAVISAHGTLDLLRWMRFREKREIGWGETTTISARGRELTLSAFKLKHWGSRFPWESHRFYNAYVLERNGRRLCFGGDTARTDASQLASRGPLDLIMLPISAYYPWISNHCTPEEAIAMAGEAQARRVLPLHYGVFKLSWEPLEEPMQRFKAALPSDLGTKTQIGETFLLPEE